MRLLQSGRLSAEIQLVGTRKTAKAPRTPKINNDLALLALLALLAVGPFSARRGAMDPHPLESPTRGKQRERRGSISLWTSALSSRLEAVETLAPIHVAQVISYLKATKLTLGLLIAFRHGAPARNQARHSDPIKSWRSWRLGGLSSSARSRFVPLFSREP